MSNNKTKYQLLLERLIGDPELKKKALEATPEQFLALCREKGLEKLSLEEATQLQKSVKSVFNGASEPVSLQNLANVAGGIDCAWDCGPLQCCPGQCGGGHRLRVGLRPAVTSRRGG